jgi:hypothetical protein
MNLREKREQETGFEEAFKRWTERAPKRSPDEAAAWIVQHSARQRPRRPPAWIYAAAAAVLITVFVITLARLPQHKMPARPGQDFQTAVPLGEGEVLLWIDKDTPLYMTFQPR